MIDGTIFFDKDYMAFVAPNPKQKPKYLALIQPFNPVVWIFVGSSIAIGVFVFLFVSKTEEEVRVNSFH